MSGTQKQLQSKMYAYTMKLQMGDVSMGGIAQLKGIFSFFLAFTIDALQKVNRGHNCCLERPPVVNIIYTLPHTTLSIIDSIRVQSGERYHEAKPQNQTRNQNCDIAHAQIRPHLCRDMRMQLCRRYQRIITHHSSRQS